MIIYCGYHVKWDFRVALVSFGDVLCNLDSWIDRELW
jgi:hypothetical protein